MSFIFDSSLPKKQIISRNPEYFNLLKNGRRVSSINFDIIFKPNNLGYPRLGYVIGKRVSNKAVKRNRIKRLIREFFRLNKSILRPYDFIFIAKKDFSGFKLESITEEILKSGGNVIKDD